MSSGYQSFINDGRRAQKRGELRNLYTGLWSAHPDGMSFGIKKGYVPFSEDEPERGSEAWLRVVNEFPGVLLGGIAAREAITVHPLIEIAESFNLPSIKHLSNNPSQRSEIPRQRGYR